MTGVQTCALPICGGNLSGGTNASTRNGSGGTTASGGAGGTDPTAGGNGSALLGGDGGGGAGGGGYYGGGAGSSTGPGAGGGGSGYYAGTVTLVETFSGANGSDVRTRSYDPGGGIKQPTSAGDAGAGLGSSGYPGLIVIQRNGP